MQREMRAFRVTVLVYCVACLVVVAVIVIRGDGLHPTVVGLYPANGDRYWPGGTAQITFSQAMDQASVDRALQVSPGSQGQAVWYGDTLNLQPVGDWKPNFTYHVMLSGSVTDAQGRPLHTPMAFWFRVHHVERLVKCPVHGVVNVCEQVGAHRRALTHSSEPVSSFSLSPDGSLVAYIHRDGSRMTHLFVIGVDSTQARQLTSGASYRDSSPTWIPGDSSSITYSRQPVALGTRWRTGSPAEIWNVQTDGSSNARLS